MYTHVSETYSGFFCSEKIFKCLAVGHPFIIVSTPKFLQGLKSKGYKTFSPYIKEDYDFIVEDEERLRAIVQEINRLCRLSESEQLEFIKNVKPIVEYNVEHFKQMGDFRATKDLLSLLK